MIGRVVMVMGPMRPKTFRKKEVHKGMTDVWMDGDEGSTNVQCFFSLLPLFRCQFTKPTWLVS